jgi:hypothetical protein
VGKQQQQQQQQQRQQQRIDECDTFKEKRYDLYSTF